MLKQYQQETKSAKIAELTEELEKYEDDDEKSKDILREIQKLQKGWYFVLYLV